LEKCRAGGDLATFAAALGYDPGLPDTIMTHRKNLQAEVGKIKRDYLLNEDWIPPREILELYMALVHWTLLLHKNVVVVLGIRARTEFINGRYLEYFETLAVLGNAVDGLRAEALEARNTLLRIITRLLSKRRHTISFSTRFEPVVEGQPEMVTYYLEDKWPIHAIGYVSPSEASRVIRTPGREV
jgi:hypothetical protein